MSTSNEELDKRNIDLETSPLIIDREEMNNDISYSTNTTPDLSDEALINKAFEFHKKGNIVEATKYYQYCINQKIKDHRIFSNFGAILKDLGKLENAEICLRKAIQLKPDFAIGHANLGAILGDLGKLTEAEQSQRKAIQLKPDYALAHSNLGAILKDLGKLNEAEQSQRKAIQLKPDYALAHSNLGAILKDLGKLNEAEQSQRKAIQLKPDYALAHSNLGVILKDLGKLNEAEQSQRKAIQLKPDYAIAHSNLGVILQDLGKSSEAEQSQRKAIQLKPDYAIAHSNLGIILIEIGKKDEAERCQRKAIEIKPNLVEAHSNLGTILLGIGKLDEAESCFRKAIEIKADFVEAYSNLGIIYKSLGKFDEALVFQRKAIDIKPDYAEAHYNLGLLLKKIGKETDSYKHLAIALKYEPKNICYFITSNLKFSTIMKDNKQIDRERYTYKKEIENLRNKIDLKFQKPHSFYSSLFYLAYHNKSDDKKILEELADTISKAKGIICKDFSHERYLKYSSTRRNLKIGICSQLLKTNHTIGKLYIQLILDLSKTDMEVNIYIPPNNNNDEIEEEIKNLSKRVVLLPYSPKIAAKEILSDQLDILFYPDIGMSSYTYILALSRLALVQVTSLGHPNTTGIKNIDYCITANKVPHRADSCYSERLIRFSRLPFNYSKPSINEKNLTNEIGINFEGSFNIGLTQSLFKLHPDYDEILESILKKIKNSYLILVKDKYDYITKDLQNRWEKKSKLLIERSIFLNRMSNDEFINTTKNCDIMLDPFYFGSGNTFYEAMAFGIPFISFSDNQIGSLVASGYSQMGVKNPPIAKSPEDYINWCLKYANNKSLLDSTKKDLRNKAEKYLFNDNEIYKEYYHFFNEAVKKAKNANFNKNNWEYTNK